MYETSSSALSSPPIAPVGFSSLIDRVSIEADELRGVYGAAKELADSILGPEQETGGAPNKAVEPVGSAETLSFGLNQIGALISMTRHQVQRLRAAA